MREWKVGDEIAILRGESDYYDVGATGVLVDKYEGEDMWEVDFSGSKTGWYDSSIDGQWAVMTYRFDLSVPVPNYD